MTATTTTPASREATRLPAVAPLPPRALATFVQVRQYLADQRLGQDHEATDDVCFTCDERTTETIVVPCGDGCCDRGMCLDCATRLGYPID